MPPGRRRQRPFGGRRRHRRRRVGDPRRGCSTGDERASSAATSTDGRRTTTVSCSTRSAAASTVAASGEQAANSTASTSRPPTRSRTQVLSTSWLISTAGTRRAAAAAAQRDVTTVLHHTRSGRTRLNTQRIDDRLEDTGGPSQPRDRLHPRPQPVERRCDGPVGEAVEPAGERPRPAMGHDDLPPGITEGTDDVTGDSRCAGAAGLVGHDQRTTARPMIPPTPEDHVSRDDRTPRGRWTPCRPRTASMVPSTTWCS